MRTGWSATWVVGLLALGIGSGTASAQGQKPERRGNVGSAVPRRVVAVPAGTEAAEQRAHWYNEAKFGMFIHWGLYAVPARARGDQLSEWVMNNENIPIAQYERFADGFTAERFDPRAWARLMRETGIRYVVLTSKHHDGFCLFDSKLTDYTAARTRAHRDLVGELARACQEQGIRFCVYYSMLDWHHPDFLPLRDGEKGPRGKDAADFGRYLKYMHGQVRELLTNYPIDGLWFDGEWPHEKEAWHSDELVSMIRERNPLAFVNDRLGKSERGRNTQCDVFTQEQEIPGSAMRQGGRFHPWETCQTFGHSWGYNQSPDPLKSGDEIVRQLVDVASKGGNFLLNIGPKPDGTIPEPFRQRMRVIGAWMAANGESLYGTSASPFDRLPAGKCTTKANRLYVHLDAKADRDLRELKLPGLKNKVTKAWFLRDGLLLPVERDGSTAVVRLPAERPDPIINVVVVELDGPPALD